MAKKRVEESKEAVATLDIDMNDMPKPVATPTNFFQQEAEPKYQPRQEKREQKELVNCLRNERVIVRFVPRETAMVHNKNHILYGGMAETATRNFVVPRLLSTGIYKNVLTDDEKDFLEYAMGLEPNALSIYRKRDNFWDDSNENGIGRVTLHKQDNYLDLSNPADYIKYKILLANKDTIAPSQEELEERIEKTKEKKQEQEELIEEILESTSSGEASGMTVTEAQDRVKTMLSKLGLIEEEIKGAAIDELK